MRIADPATLGAEILRTRAALLDLLSGLGDGDWQVPYRTQINPPLWELGHVGWFQEHWCLRQMPAGQLAESCLPGADALYDSGKVAHASRWSLPLPSPQATRVYLDQVMHASLERLSRLAHDDASLYFHRLALFHEQMHYEAFAYTWQTLARPRPAGLGALAGGEPGVAAPQPSGTADLMLDCAPAGGVHHLGSIAGSGFVFDNEKWRHPVPLPAYRIASRPVTNRQFLQFVEDGGYLDPAHWSPQLHRRLRADGRAAPVCWRKSESGWQQRVFDRWLALQPDEPVVHVDAFEAQAYCHWAGKTLPTEAQWEWAAQHQPAFGWGSQVWEWTASPFLPFDGFVADPYKDYSQPWFGDHRVVRGASFATPRAMVDARLRNFYLPERADLFVGFRTSQA